ncbi:hypothetical protein ABZZ74_43945 [Streptomyces sp. NPDC006476]|uniref:hypothetical protein n=1 Tax=Streptomyces sp. NPDC006476 TaxID=3157175 RepID=UPI0033B4ADAA
MGEQVGGRQLRRRGAEAGVASDGRDDSGAADEDGSDGWGGWDSSPASAGLVAGMAVPGVERGRGGL